MLFWIVAALMTLVASLAVYMPLARGTGSASAASRNEIEVYRDQLAEVDRDLKRGLLDAGEADQARAEIGRRIIKADGAAAGAGGGFAGMARYVATVGILAVPLISWGVYAAIGKPDLPGQPLAARASCGPETTSVEQLVFCAERQLAQNPADARGWDILAPIYLRMNRVDDALNAARSALRVGGANAERFAALGEALVYSGGGMVSADARTAFEDALKAQPGMSKARFFLAMAKAQEGKADEGIAEWRDLVATMPENDPWRNAAQVMISRSEQQQAPAEGMPGPEAIEGMVAGLDERLREAPNDPEGWKRLVRSYVVLGKPDQAKDALTRALKALGADSAVGKDIVAFAASQGVNTE